MHWARHGDGRHRVRLVHPFRIMQAQNRWEREGEDKGTGRERGGGRRDVAPVGSHPFMGRGLLLVQLLSVGSITWVPPFVERHIHRVTLAAKVTLWIWRIHGAHPQSDLSG